MHGHHHHCEHGHDDHHLEIKNPAAELKIYLIVFGIQILVFVFQLIGSYLSSSIALLSDTMHVLIDANSQLLAIATAFLVIKKIYPENKVRSISGFISAGMLAATAAFIGYEAIERLLNPAAVKISLMLLFVVPGAIANALSIMIVSVKQEGNITKTALLRHIAVDLGQSVIVILAGILMYLNPIWLAKLTSNSFLIDPVLSLIFTFFAFYLAYRTAKDALYSYR